MSVVARMRVNSITLNGYSTLIKLNPVMPSEGQEHYEEIKAFYAATPTGEFTASINNELAAEQFQPGKEFYITLTEIPKSDG